MTIPETCPRCGSKEKERPEHNKPAVDHTNRQRVVFGITKKILQHAAELRTLADELDDLGCDCGRAAQKQRYLHSVKCPIRMACGARSMARPTYKVPGPPPASKDVRHLTPPFRPPTAKGPPG
jgi:hypothetical protein